MRRYEYPLADLTQEELGVLEQGELNWEAGELERLKARFHRKTESCRRRPRWPVAVLAAALLLGMAAAGTALYQRWRLPAPETYQGDMWKVTGEREYIASTPDPAVSIVPLSDGDFLRRASEILRSVDLTEIDESRMTVMRRQNEQYDRREVEVRYPRAEEEASVTFHEESGELLQLTCFQDHSSQGLYDSYELASGRAEELYCRLPVAQGYVLRGDWQFDEEAWSFDFSREVRKGIYSDYETVRITVNPQNGQLVLANVFCTPLLDDHEEGEKELTASQAEVPAREVLESRWPEKSYVLESAEVRVVQPNYWFTEYEDSPENRRFSKVTRLAWVLTYANPEETLFADKIMVHVDLYTGEILGGDAMR